MTKQQEVVHFNPRSPSGERPGLSSPKQIRLLISIHALQAESDFFVLDVSQLLRISIHALQAESDIPSFCSLLSPSDFNPRSPSGERLAPRAVIIPVRIISIHALQAESDVNRYLYNPIGTNISIHALQAESDDS